jgi:hypothetical protein
MNFSDMTTEALTTLRGEKVAARDALLEIEQPTMAQAEEAEGFQADIDAIDAVFADRTEAPKRMEALRAKATVTAATEEASTEEAAEGGDADDNTTKGGSGNAEGEVKTEDSPGEAIKPGEVADAEGKGTPLQESAVAELAAKTSHPGASKGTRNSGPVVITASAGVEGYETGQSLSLIDVAKGAIARARGFSPPQGDGKTINLQKFGTAQFALDFPEDLIIDRGSSSEEIDDILNRAADESRLSSSSGSGSLVAAGGWCAPSETVYDLTQDATAEGMLSLPEVGVKRGGMRFAQSPTFADFYANPGFIQTEAQAIAGTTKPCVEVDCPDFTEVRLDVEGLCIKVPILTNAGYPEYVRNFVEGTLVAHQHWINANVIGRIVTAAGAARVITGLGSTLTDTLEGLELLADQTRQKYRLSMNRTLEVVMPFWVRGAIRSDLARRNGVPFEQVSDAQVASAFKSRKLNPQFVYDWQALDETAEVYPATFNAVMYPAGTFVKGTADVINLSTVYDAASLATNVYTGLFTEQGLLVAKRKFHADLITLPICNAGRTGAANLTCA